MVYNVVKKVSVGVFIRRYLGKRMLEDTPAGPSVPFWPSERAKSFHIKREYETDMNTAIDQSSERMRGERNRTLTIDETESQFYQRKLLRLSSPMTAPELENRTINQNLLEVIELLPHAFVDLLFIDPPYNLTKSFATTQFKQSTSQEYTAWLESWLPRLLKVLKDNGSVYICSDWRSSTAIHSVAEKYLKVQNRITWEREKGRGARSNWKNCTEDIWFCTKSEDYTFHADSVKLKRRVIAPYRDEQGKPKDWEVSEEGNYRLTHPSNIWTDITIPFWSMPENTDHPTQKPEKLLAKILLASSNRNDFILDPFLGSGTTSVVAKKLGRRYLGIEREAQYCCLAEKRLEAAANDGTIQGYSDGVFWERNSLPIGPRTERSNTPSLFSSVYEDGE